MDRKSIRFRALVFTLILLAAHCLIGGSPGAGERKIPFAPGEKLTYEGRWGILPAGEVTLEVLPRETIEGVETYHFAMITRTNAAVDLLYPIRERQDSYVAADMSRSVLYKKKTESKHPRDVVVKLDWERMQTTRTNFGESSVPIPIVKGTIDPLALFYVLRVYDLTENRVIEIPVTDGSTNYRVKATVGKRGVIEIKGKKYPSIEVVPDMQRLEGIVKESDSPELKIWFSADEKKIPLKIQSKVGIISFVFEFEAMAPGRG
jgi:hypothetical protein